MQGLLSRPTSLITVVGAGGTDIGGSGTANPNWIRAGLSTSWAPTPQVPGRRVADVILDIEFPAAPVVKYHIYSYSESMSGMSLPLRDQGLPGWT